MYHNLQRAVGDTGTGQEIYQVWVSGRPVRVVAVDAGGTPVDNVFAMGERIVAVQAAGIVAFEADL